MTSSLIQAQVIPDGTLSTTVNTSNNLDFIITNGEQLGGNLFHSFQEFTVPQGGSASYSNGLDVQNIFSRVTGNSVSEINGLIQANGSSNLFLLNPNGIIFGPNAQLNIGGSFIASTASQVNFSDGSAFDTTNTQIKPLLTVSMPIGLQFRENLGDIINRSRSISNVLGIDGEFGLKVLPGKTLALIGGNILLEKGILTTVEGRIELGSIAAPAEIPLIPADAGWEFDYSGVREFQDIHLTDEAIVQTALETGGAGDILLQGKRILLSENSGILSFNFSETSGRTITLKASESVEINKDSRILTISSSLGDAADINIETRWLVVQDDGSVINTGTDSDGRGGDLTINASELVEVNAKGGFAHLTTETFTNGDAGTLKITTGKLILRNGAQISSSTASVGNGGQIIINALDSLEISGTGLFLEDTVVISGVFAQTTGNDAKGNAGNIDIDTRRLIVQDGARISVAGVQESLGQAGNLTINANFLTLNGGIITAETAKSGTEEGANITLQLSDSLRLENESSISATANGDANGGNININTPLLTVFPPTGLNGSDIIANAERGRGGNITINAQGIFGIAERQAIPENQSNDIDASSEFGASGQVEINSTIDPNRGVVQLPETVVDPNALVAQNPCKQGSESELVVTGRGGLPPSLNENLNSEVTQVDLLEPVPINSGEKESKEVEELKRSSPSEPTPIVPAQGWIFNEKGEVVLTAYNPKVTDSQRLKEKSASCPEP